MTDLRNAKIQVIFRTNELAEPIALEKTVSPIVFDLSPLPADHDMPSFFHDKSTELAVREKKLARQRIANYIAKQIAPFIAEAVVDTIQQQDPVRGYSREEWERMKGRQ